MEKDKTAGQTEQRAAIWFIKSLLVLSRSLAKPIPPLLFFPQLTFQFSIDSTDQVHLIITGHMYNHV